MFDISAKLIVGQSDEIFWVSQISWEDSPWRQLSFGQWWRSHQSLACKSLCVFGFCVMSWKKWIRTQHQILFGKNSWVGSKIHNNTELWTHLSGSRWNSSGVFRRIHHIAALQRPRVHDQDGDPSQFQGRIIFMSIFNDIIWDLQTMNGNSLLTPHLWFYLQKDFQQDWSFLGPGS